MTGWHILHRGQVSYEGVVINVPPGWVPEPKSWKNTPAPALIKLPVTVLSLHFLGRISLGPEYKVFQATPENLQNWRQAAESLYRADDYVIQGPTASHGGDDSYCIVALPHQQEANAFADCYIRQGAWRGSFLGRSSDVEMFLKTAREIH